MRRHASCVAIESVRNVLIALVSHVRVLFIIVRISAEEFGRKFGSAPDAPISNSIEDAGNPVAKEEGSIVQTILEIGMQVLPVIIDTLTRNTGPSQTDRIEGIDLNGEDPFSMKNILQIGLKLFLAIAGGGSGNDKSDSSPVQGVLEAVIGALVGAEDRQEVAIMAKQATEVINLVVQLVEALTTSISQRSFF
ncbi:uncharacterized protein LOC111708949 [Eurytemora carolleeae]|uniref:uncharacterized protein LOC111708949 n=1 Tax=Eurytemora carolleeae TaxID=1294199 RepID=UPI000C75C2BE|nr:uncharacterized protein LOC111708949 [Eurytemora carolleeae]|eukprot:XP_023338239.1 uncharacterized protein LOC111708949 [Eurytemora affinis]